MQHLVPTAHIISVFSPFQVAVCTWQCRSKKYLSSTSSHLHPSSPPLHRAPRRPRTRHHSLTATQGTFGPPLSPNRATLPALKVLPAQPAAPALPRNTDRRSVPDTRRRKQRFREHDRPSGAVSPSCQVGPTLHAARSTRFCTDAAKNSAASGNSVSYSEAEVRPLKPKYDLAGEPERAGGRVPAR